MAQIWHQASTAIAFGLAGLCLASASTSAQLTPDQTLGTESSIVAPNATVRGLSADLIQGGAARGVNLFHSFFQFNVRDGQRVYFANPIGIETILSRVTGTNPSRIFGTLGVNGTANLFLINPNGILFGANARLDVAGSFLASTANSFKFPDGSEFSATNPQAAPLLTLNIRPGLQYGANHQATISSTGNLTAGKDLTLAAGNLDLQGQLQAGGDLTLRALDTVKVRDRTTTPFIAAAGGKLTVQGDRAIDIFALNHPNSGFFSGGDMVLRSANPISGDAHYTAGGGLRFEQLNGAPGGLISLDDPVLLVNGDVFLGDYVGPSLHIVAGGNVFLGNVTITGPGGIGTTINPLNPDPFLSSLSFTDYGVVDGFTQGTLDVRAGLDWAGLPIFSNSGVGFPFVTSFPFTPLVSNPTGSTISVGNITNTNGIGSIYLSNQYFPNPFVLSGSIFTESINTFGNLVLDSRGGIFTGGNIDTGSNLPVNAGNIKLLANGNIITGGTIESSVKVGGVGNGGDITLISRLGNIDTQGGFVNSSTGLGLSGDITFTAFGNIVTGSNSATGLPAVGSYIGAGGTGIAGRVTLTSQAGSIDTRRGELNSASDTNGISGDITLTAAGNVAIGDIKSFSNSNFLANAGSIKIDSGANVSIIGATLDSTTNGASRGGDIIITARSNISAIGSTIKSETTGTGRGGDIGIAAESVTFSANPFFQSAFTDLRANTNGAGNAGNIAILTQSLDITGGSEVRSQTFDSGNAGNITVLPLDLNRRSAASVTISGFAPFPTLANGDRGGFSSGLFATTEKTATGRGGTIDVTTGSLVIEQGGVLSARSRGAGDGVQTAGDTAIAVNVDSLIIRSGGQILTTAFGSGLAGGIEVNATGNVLITGSDPTRTQRFSAVEAIFGADIARDTIDTVSRFSGLQAQSLSNSGTGSGNVQVTSENGSIVLLDSARINSNTAGRNAPAGIVLLNANQGNVVLDNAFVFSTVEPGAVDSAAGGIGIEGKSIFLSGGAQLQTLIRGTVNSAQPDTSGATGLILLQAEDQVSLVGSGTAIFSSIEKRAIGRAGADQFGLGFGAVGIAADTILIRDGAKIDVATKGQGDAGQVLLLAEDRISLENRANIFSTVEAGATGSAGGVFVQTGYLSLQSGSGIQALTRGTGDAGAISIFASGLVEIAGFNQFASGLFASSEANAKGDAGSIFVQANALQILDRGVVSARTQTEFNAGNVVFNVAGDVRLADRGQVTVSGTGTGNPGNINITAGRSIQMFNGSAIKAETASGENANITVQTQGAIVMGCCGNEISAEARGVGNGGNISISALAIITFLANNNDIVANAEDGRGGNIFITSPFFKGSSNRSRRQGNLLKSGSVRVFREGKIRTLESDITASSEFGVDGIVDIPGDNQFELLPQLPATFRDITDLVTSKCSYGEKGRSRFVTTGRGGIAPSPTDPLYDESVTVNWVSVPAGDRPSRETAPQTAANQPPTKIIEAQEWVQEADGKISLVAYAANAVTPHSWLRSPECDEKRQLK